MGKRIKDCEYYVNRIIKVNSEISKDMIFETDAERRKHNRYSRESYRIFDELYDNVELATEVYSALMKHEDPYIRQTGATSSLIMRINAEEAVPILEWCVENMDGLHSWGARRRLMMFRGKMPEDTKRRPPKGLEKEWQEWEESLKKQKE